MYVVVVSVIDACQVIWQKKLNQQLFGVSGIDITGNGYENLVFSSWDGSTYIFDQENNCLQFQFEDQVCGFIAGRLISLKIVTILGNMVLGEYSIKPGKKVPCLIYVTFFDEIFIYFKLTKVTKIFLEGCKSNVKPQEEEISEDFNLDDLSVRDLKNLKNKLFNLSKTSKM